MALNSQEGKRPSVVELQNFVRQKQKLEFLLVDGESKKGFLKWFDDSAFSLEVEGGRTLTLLRENVIGYGPI